MGPLTIGVISCGVQLYLMGRTRCLVLNDSRPRDGIQDIITPWRLRNKTEKNNTKKNSYRIGRHPGKQKPRPSERNQPGIEQPVTNKLSSTNNQIPDHQNRINSNIKPGELMPNKIRKRKRKKLNHEEYNQIMESFYTELGHP